MQTDQEHEQNESHLAEGIQVAQTGGREDGMKQIRGCPAEKRRAEQNACHHLAHHSRLADKREDSADDLRDRQDHHCG
jgi:hypothetical protein